MKDNLRDRSERHRMGAANVHLPPNLVLHGASARVRFGSKCEELHRQSADQWHAVERAAVGLRLFGVELSEQPYDYERALAQSPSEARGALLMMSSAFLLRDRDRIVDLARQHRMASIFALREYADAGGLISYGPSLSALVRRVADYVDRIARGARPSDLPIEQPTKFELVINLKTAKALGLTLPPLFLARADEVIE